MAGSKKLAAPPHPALLLADSDTSCDERACTAELLCLASQFCRPLMWGSLGVHLLEIIPRNSACPCWQPCGVHDLTVKMMGRAWQWVHLDQPAFPQATEPVWTCPLHTVKSHGPTSLKSANCPEGTLLWGTQRREKLWVNISFPALLTKEVMVSHISRLVLCVCVCMCMCVCCRVVQL